MVSGGTVLGDLPAVLMDEYQGMRQAVAHLLQIHGRRRVAFIRGPKDHAGAQKRYRAYLDALAGQGLALDPALVTPPGHWSYALGLEGVRLLLDERHVDLDGVAAASDWAAIGAIQALQARGIRVPDDVPVVGFNDVTEAGSITPPLTTVRPPFYEMGAKAVEMLLALIEGAPVSYQVMMPSKLIIRQSCGCQSTAVAQAAAGPVRPGRKSFAAAWPAQRSKILAEMAQEVGASSGLERLLDSFAVEVKSRSSGAFIRELEDVLGQALAEEQDPAAWQSALSILRRRTLSCRSNVGASRRFVGTVPGVDWGDGAAGADFSTNTGRAASAVIARNWSGIDNNF